MISVVIPVYKNAEMVMRNLKHNMPYFNGYDVIVVDDASDEGLASKIRKAFPSINVIENEQNKGFAPTVNIGVQAAKEDLVALLGSDVRLMKPFPKEILDRFKQHDGLFAVSFKQKERDGSVVGKNRIYFKNGLPNHAKTRDIKKGLNGWADAGSGIFRTSYFRELGGLNEVFAPFYWEDIDLSYRAYSRGWYVEFEPGLYVEHHHESTIGKLFSSTYVKTIAYRNQFIFTWANITDKAYWRSHLMSLPRYLFVFTIKGDFAFIKGFILALVKMSRISKDRERKVEHQLVSDPEIFARFE